MDLATLHDERRSPGRGQGQFSRVPIAVGRPIFHEAPIFITEDIRRFKIFDQYINMGSKSAALRRRLKMLFHIGNRPPFPLDKEVLDLSPCLQRQTTRIETYALSLSGTSYVKGAKASGGSGIIALSENNCFQIRNHDGSYVWGIFEAAVRLNHSCIPNCSYSWNEGLKELYVHSIRDIKKGGELIITDDAEDHFFDCIKERSDWLLMRCAFKRSCPACEVIKSMTGKNDNRDSKLEKIANLKKRIADLKAAGYEGTAHFEVKRTEILQLKAEQGFETWEGGKA